MACTSINTVTWTFSANYNNANNEFLTFKRARGKILIYRSGDYFVFTTRSLSNVYRFGTV